MPLHRSLPYDEKERVNVFSLFGLKPSLEVDKKELDRKYAELIMQNHPDKFVNKSLEERKQAVDNTEKINMAYKVLSSPKAICQYMIDEMMQGQQEGSEEIVQDNEYISLTIELHQRLHGIKTLSDCRDLELTINRMYDAVFSKARNCIIGKNAISAQKYINEMNFLERVLKDTERKAFELASTQQRSKL